MTYRAKVTGRFASNQVRKEIRRRRWYTSRGYEPCEHGQFWGCTRCFIRAMDYWLPGGPGETQLFSLDRSSILGSLTQMAQPEALNSVPQHLDNA